MKKEADLNEDITLAVAAEPYCGVMTNQVDYFSSPTKRRPDEPCEARINCRRLADIRTQPGGQHRRLTTLGLVSNTPCFAIVVHSPNAHVIYETNFQNFLSHSPRSGLTYHGPVRLCWSVISAGERDLCLGLINRNKHNRRSMDLPHSFSFENLY